MSKTTFRNSAENGQMKNVAQESKKLSLKIISIIMFYFATDP